MVSHGIREQVCRQVSDAVAQVSGSGWWGGGSLLPAEKVMEALKAEGVKFRQCLFTPMVTLWTFPAQVMGPDRSCRAAVAKLQAWMATQQALGTQGADGALAAPAKEDRAWEEMDTGPYCKARERLPEQLLSRLALEAGDESIRGVIAELLDGD